MNVKPKLKKCAVCQEIFTPRATTQKVCNWECSLILINETKKKKEKQKASREKKEFYDNDRRFQLKKAQEVFNAFIRARDKHLPCVSCGRYHDGQYHAGHFFTVGARPELRFHPLNCHKQCAPCNNHLSGNISEYMPNLIEKIGQESFDYLKNNQSKHKYTLDDIVGIKKYYKEMLKTLNDVNMVRD